MDSYSFQESVLIHLLALATPSSRLCMFFPSQSLPAQRGLASMIKHAHDVIVQIPQPTSWPQTSGSEPIRAAFAR